MEAALHAGLAEAFALSPAMLAGVQVPQNPTELHRAILRGRVVNISIALSG